MNWKEILLMLCCFCLRAMVFSQSRNYQIKADTVRIFNSCDTAELVLENRSRTVTNGVLTNTGGGITEFRKVMQQVNDSVYLIGGDTLFTSNFGKNIYNADGALKSDRSVDGNQRKLSFKNNGNYLISNTGRPVVISRSPIDSSLLSRIEKINIERQSPYSGLIVRGTGCDATIELVSDSAGTCNETQAIDFTTLKPRKDSWLTSIDPNRSNKYLLGRIQLETSAQLPDYSVLKFAIKSDTAFYKDGGYVLYTPGKAGGNTPYPVMSVNPSYKDPSLGINTRMPFVQVNGGLFVGFGRNWYFNSKNANDIIPGVDDVPGNSQPFYETRFSVYADSLPLKIFKLPAMKANAFLTYSPGGSVEGNNVAFEYKDSVYEEIRNYIANKGLPVQSDFSLKENIVVSRFNSKALLALRVHDFNYKADQKKTRYTGLIAQELKVIAPELVLGTAGSYNIDYIKMVPYLLKTLQDQQQEINKLILHASAQHEKLEEMMASLANFKNNCSSRIAAPKKIAEKNLPLKN